LPKPDLPRASLAEGLRFTAQVAVPNVVQGLFRRRRKAVAVATKANADGLAIGFLSGLKRRYGAGPLWIKVAKDDALLLLGPEAIRDVLEASPDPFAADPPPKRRGMSHFQPDALTISRGDAWADRRRFTEAVLDTGRPVHRLGDRFAVVCVEEAKRLLGGGLELDWDRFNLAVRRATRRIILGDAAADDEELSELLGELMDEANRLPKKRSSDRYDRFANKVAGYVSAGVEGSLVGLFGEAPVTSQTKPAGQVTHWLFALGDTLAINAYRCLALLATHEQQRARVLAELSRAELSSGAGVAGMRYLDACLEEALRLWPTAAMLSREALPGATIDGAQVPAGTQILFVNTFNHRDPEAHEFADRFAPEAWLEGGAASDWSFNHFSHGPQGCPGTGIAKFVGKAMIGTVLCSRDVRLAGTRLDPGTPLPHMLDHFGLKFSLSARDS
jgi:cytochrome P450